MKTATSVEATLEAVQVQVASWLERPHPFECFASNRETAQAAAEVWRDINNARERMKVLSWDGVLSERLFLALAADPAERSSALIQLAAVSLAAAVSETQD